MLYGPPFKYTPLTLFMFSYVNIKTKFAILTLENYGAFIFPRETQKITKSNLVNIKIVW